MTLSARAQLQVDLFGKALQKLKDLLPENETDIVRDAMIQRFEFTYEMAWRSLFRVLRDSGENVAEHGATVLTAAHTAQLLQDAAIWTQIRESRNKTSHTYEESVAIAVAAAIRSVAVPEFDKLYQKLAAL